MRDAGLFEAGPNRQPGRPGADDKRVNINRFLPFYEFRGRDIHLHIEDILILLWDKNKLQ
jgi:hypothetical protein